MKKGICLSALFLILFSTVAAPQKIRCAAEILPPYIIWMKSSEPGYAVELVRAVMPTAKYQFEFHHSNWNSCLYHMQKNWGNIECFLGAAHTDFGGRYVNVPVFKMQSAIYVRKNSDIRYKDMDSLLQGKTVMTKDYSHTDELDAYTEKHQTDGKIIFNAGWDASVKNVRALLRGEAMFLIDNIDSVNWALKRLRKTPSDVILLKKLDNEMPFFLVFRWNKKYEQPVKDFNTEIRKYMKTEGYKKLRAKYGIQN